MTDYQSIRKVCEKSSNISRAVIDDFLIYYAASHNNLNYRMNKQFSAYNHVTRELQKELVNMLEAQYLAHKIFKNEGLIEKYLKHAVLQRLNKNEILYLEQQAAHPWRFSFSVINSNPAEDFYIMEDVFSGEQYTLFSPGTTKVLRKHSVPLWFNLIGYNGSCWQSYGPIAYYMAFEPDDIFFFASMLRPGIEYDEDVLEDVENNPVPYMMLISGGNYPVTINKNDLLVRTLSEYDMDTINTSALRNSFKIEHNDEAYRFSLKDWDIFPHFAQAYFDEKKRIIVLTAFTDRGFHALVSGLNKFGHHFSDIPFVRVKPSMIATAENILKTEIVLNEYEEIFSDEKDTEDNEEMEKINAFLTMALPDINTGRQPDIDALAEKAGVDINTARDLIREVMKKLDNFDKPSE
ncbi:MAG: hypothetical protein GXO83_02075 [Chlorobi bacterium]|nr:hypothetical protein [Chlorobiota bacterium]